MWYDCISMSPMMFFPIIIMFLLLFLIYNFFNKDKNSSQNSLDILKLKYANGEITKEEYNEIKKDIS